MKMATYKNLKIEPELKDFLKFAVARYKKRSIGEYIESIVPDNHAEEWNKILEAESKPSDSKKEEKDRNDESDDEWFPNKIV